MSKIRSFIMITAGLLLAACSDSTPEQGDSFITPNGTQAVKVQFAFNVPYGNQSTTRMSSATVQEGVTTDYTIYRNMQDISLVPLTSQPQTSGSNPIPFENVQLANSTVEVTSSYSANFYQDVTIPVGTTNFLFYSEAKRPDGFSTTNIDDMFSNGYVDKPADMRSLTSTDGLQFSLKSIASSSSMNTEMTTLLGIINGIASVSGWPSTVGSDGKPVVGDPGYSLGEAYAAFVNVGTARNGSANGIRLTVQALYNKVKHILPQYANTSAQYTIASAIISKIEENFTATATGNTGESTTSPGYLADAYTLSYTSTDSKLTDFPVTQGLPEGAAQLAFSGGAFSYVNPKVLDGTDPTTSATGVRIDDICFPPPLLYYVDTPIRTTNKEYGENGEAWPAVTVTDWENDSKWTSSGTTWGNKVLPTTKSIALINNIYYGVSRLITTVRCSTTTLKDNSAPFDGVDKEITINRSSEISGDPSNLKGFILTGVLLGGQPKTVGWNFLSASTSGHDQVVYDKAMNTKTYTWTEDGEQKTADYGPLVLQAADASTAMSTLGVNHTLVLDNYVPNAPAQEAARICLELENHTGVDFYGADGLILNGQKFYLVGQLSAPSSGSISWVKGTNNTYKERFPAYGAGKERSFVMDYTTQANIAIGAESLKKAYVTIPDLRIPKIGIGLSIDISWTPGVTYEADMDFTD